MATLISCPECQQKLNVPDTVVGKKVKCPKCSHTFIAPGREEPEPPPEAPASEPFEDLDEPEQPKPKRRRSRSRDDDDDGPSGGVPHRGDTIMVLGILSIVLGFPIGLVMAIIALNMANADILQMASGGMDREGKGRTQTGKTCATIGIVLNLVGLLVCCGCVGLQIMVGLANA